MHTKWKTEIFPKESCFIDSDKLYSTFSEEKRKSNSIFNSYDSSLENNWPELFEFKNVRSAIYLDLTEREEQFLLSIM